MFEPFILNFVFVLLQKLPKTVPCLFVATKTDGSAEKQVGTGRIFDSLMALTSTRPLSILIVP